MEALNRLVSESLARHGFDRPLDYRRLQWSRWFRCDSHHSLLFVPSKPGVFALAEEIAGNVGQTPSRAILGGAALQRCDSAPLMNAPLAAEVKPKRMLAVAQFFEDDDMAFILDRMLSIQNPMRSRLLSGRYFVRFVAIEDQTQRRTICSALNQWMVSASEKATGIGSHFASSLELTPANEYVPQPNDLQSNVPQVNVPQINASQPSLFAGATDTHIGAEAFARTAERTDATLLAAASTNREEPDFSRAEKAQNFSALVVEGAASNSAPRPQSGKSSITLAIPHTVTPHRNDGAAANIHRPCPIPSGF